ncbi:MAG: TIGR00268 family protein, partial [Planctomycetota bacterium]|nr:TIGR00268 family protein [Planctomycetota bacterium]
HEGELARIEVAREEMERIVQLEVSGKLSTHLREIGFRFITLDLQGFRSGSMNRELVAIGVKLNASGT